MSAPHAIKLNPDHPGKFTFVGNALVGSTLYPVLMRQAGDGLLNVLIPAPDILKSWAERGGDYAPDSPHLGTEIKRALEATSPEQQAAYKGFLSDQTRPDSDVEKFGIKFMSAHTGRGTVRINVLQEDSAADPDANAIFTVFPQNAHGARRIAGYSASVPVSSLGPVKITGLVDNPPFYSKVGSIGLETFMNNHSPAPA